MKTSNRKLTDETDFWQLRNFLRETFLLNGRTERSWHVARLDYLRWHFIQNCRVFDSVEKAISIWEDGKGKIAAFVTGLGNGEIRLHVHPWARTKAFLLDVSLQAAEQFAAPGEDGRLAYLPVDEDDQVLQAILIDAGYEKVKGESDKWQRVLDGDIPVTRIPEGYTIRSMGGEEEHPARSWASWRAFHNDEPDQNYDGDHSWFRNIQHAPLYRRDLDIVAVTDAGGIASFCTVYYDDATRSAVCVLVGTAVEHWRRGLGKAVILEGMRRLKQMGCERVFATGFDAPASALYGSVMQERTVAETWIKRF